MGRVLTVAHTVQHSKCDEKQEIGLSMRSMSFFIVLLLSLVSKVELHIYGPSEVHHQGLFIFAGAQTPVGFSLYFFF